MTHIIGICRRLSCPVEIAQDVDRSERECIVHVAAVSKAYTTKRVRLTLNRFLRRVQTAFVFYVIMFVINMG